MIQFNSKRYCNVTPHTNFQRCLNYSKQNGFCKHPFLVHKFAYTVYHKQGRILTSSLCPSFNMTLKEIIFCMSVSITILCYLVDNMTALNLKI